MRAKLNTLEIYIKVETIFGVKMAKEYVKMFAFRHLLGDTLEMKVKHAKKKGKKK